MSNLLLIPFGPDVLALTPEQFEVARTAGASFLAKPSSTSVETPACLITADELAEATSMSRSMIYELAKAQRIPVVRIGRKVRFDRALALAALSRNRVGESHARQ